LILIDYFKENQKHLVSGVFVTVGIIIIAQIFQCQ